MPSKGATAANTPTVGKTKAPRAKNVTQSNKEVTQLIKKLTEAKNNGLTSENGFKSIVQTNTAASFSNVLKQVNRTYESKWTRVKKDYKDVKFVRELSGYRQNDTTKIVTIKAYVQAELEKVIIYLYIYTKTIY